MSATFEALTGLTLLHAWWLWLALLVPAALWLGRRSRGPVLTFAPGPFLRPAAGERAPLSWRRLALPLPRTLQALALLLVVVALARPVERTALPLRAAGIDILLCLDLSSSMTANDMDRRRTRLEVAQDAADAFVAGRPADRVGLLCFARYPDVRCPLTLDHAALRAVLADVTTVDGDGPEDATGIGTATARAAQVLSSAASTSRVVILLTDGEENVATQRTPGEIAPLHAAQLCEELGVRVYTIAVGVGNPDRQGGWVPVDTSQVRRLSERTGGRFFEARDAAAVGTVYALIDELERVEGDEPRYRIEERFLGFLVAAVVLLLAGQLLDATVLEVLP